jgi:hypothetical protein
VRVAQGYRVEMADTACPQRGRNYFFADIKILRRLLWATAKSTTVYKQSFAVGRDQQQGVALPDVDRFDEQRIARMVNWPWSNCGTSSARKRSPGGTA